MVVQAESDTLALAIAAIRAGQVPGGEVLENDLIEGVDTVVFLPAQVMAIATKAVELPLVPAGENL